MQHPDDIEYFQRIQRIGFAAAKEYGIRCLVIEAKKRPQTGYGNAYVLEDKICVSVRDKRTKDFGGQWAKHRCSHSDVLHTLAHELAHLAPINGRANTSATLTNSGSTMRRYNNS